MENTSDRQPPAADLRAEVELLADVGALNGSGGKPSRMFWALLASDGYGSGKPIPKEIPMIECIERATMAPLGFPSGTDQATNYDHVADTALDRALEQARPPSADSPAGPSLRVTGPGRRLGQMVVKPCALGMGFERLALSERCGLGAPAGGGPSGCHCLPGCGVFATQDLEDARVGLWNH